ncbi:hypothetical protein RHMOL_Rhmol03G0217000 [Rhododendron molle]|uniref:Uncharacterized protein n=1 Tax=Rhododendron molle TaxID=49168 RepID=A0ACC0PGN9_RHOML|nr:hypothetical protein RHMOL_Rhmol03G0217000 [Rhododendron molle]
MKLSRDGLLSPPSTSATCGSGEKPTDATIHACRPTKERDELVRKGILTPFHKLKGFERRIQTAGPSNRHNVSEEDNKSDDLASTSTSRAVRSMSEAAQARPTTKLLNSESRPKLEAPTHPFQRLRTPLKVPRSPEKETDTNKGTLRKRKRPLPRKKWRKLASKFFSCTVLLQVL